MSGLNLGAARRTYTISTADLRDPNGILTSQPTETDAVDFAVVDLDGAAVTSDGQLRAPLTNTSLVALPRTVSVTTSAETGAYNTEDPIVITGFLNGAPQTESLLLTDADGDETVFGTKLFSNITSIQVPEQLLDSGALEVGVADVGAPGAEGIRRIRAHAVGNMALFYGLGSGDSDLLPFNVDEGHEDVSPMRIGSDPAVTTVTAFTLYS